MSTRHKWGEPVRIALEPPDGMLAARKTERACTRGCGIVKVTRHETNAHGVESHWLEFWRGLDRIRHDATPPCTGEQAL